MCAFRIPMVFMAGIVFASGALVPTICLAQEKSVAETSQPNTDLGGCADLKGVPKLAESVIVSCDKGDSIEVILPLKPDARGIAQEKSVRGFYEFREYRISQFYQQEQAFENLMRLLPIGGFTVKYSASPSTITARTQDEWILITVSGEYYDVKAVRVSDTPWTPVKDTQEISREMETHKRVAIYGIEFSPDNQAIIEDKSKILAEVLRYLKGNPALSVAVESHKMTQNGNAEDDQEIARRRATAVVDWLEVHGIVAGRLRAKALGRSKPITENDFPLEIQKNERIELVQTAP